MKSLHFNQHMACQTCLTCGGDTNSSIEMKEVAKGILYQEQAVLNIIIFLLSGEIVYSFGMYNNRKMHQGQILYLPVNYNFTYGTESEARILFIRSDRKIQFCDCYKLEDLVGQTRQTQAHSEGAMDSPYLLKMNNVVKAYTDMLVHCISKELYCRYYNQMKINELFYLFGEFYPKEELGLFFREVFSRDSGFSHFVMTNYHKYHSLSELATAMNITLSGLGKRFKKAFNTSGYKWMNDHRVKKIYHALCIGEKSLNELRAEFGFATKSSFNRYCKQHLGCTPGEIRKAKDVVVK